MQTITRYQKRISGPMLDRIDIHIEVLRLAYQKLNGDRLGEQSVVVQARVEAARVETKTAIQCVSESANEQIDKWQGVFCNAGMRPGDIRKYCPLDKAGNSLMRAAMQQIQLSARAYHRVLKLACTIAIKRGMRISDQLI